MQTGNEIYALLKELFPICRSLTGDGNRETLAILNRHIPLKIHEVRSGTKVFDWAVPDEWNCTDAILSRPNEVIADFQKSNLHVVGYSQPVDKKISLDELQPHLHSLPQLPEAIPYVTSYYRPDWGFCLPHQMRESLTPGDYHAYIKSSLDPYGWLTYADLVIPGETEKECFLSTYICHPSMANDNLSGVVIATALGKWLLSQPKRRYTYRLLFCPETIGALVYLGKHIGWLREHVVAGLQLTCLGDEGGFSWLPSRKDELQPYGFKKYSWLERGSDERQWCAPGVDLPMCSIMRSKYATFPEYHTSLDNLDFVTPKALGESFEMIKGYLDAMEQDPRYRATCVGEPFMTKYNLYHGEHRDIYMDILTYADGRQLSGIARALNKPLKVVAEHVGTLLQHKLVERI